MKNKKKGFTLVELIVVLAILAILAAMLVPALTGYIDKANQKKIVAEARSAVVAAQTVSSEYYGAENKTLTADQIISGEKNEEIMKLAELVDKGHITSVTVGTKGEITRLVWDSGKESDADGKNVCTYENGGYTVS